MEFLYDYGLFLAKTATFVAAIGFIIALIASAAMRQKDDDNGELQITDLTERYQHDKDTLLQSILSKEELKTQHKADKKAAKEKQKAQKNDPETKPARLFVLDFKGDIRASSVDLLSREVSVLLSVADKERGDEVLLKLESSGGLVHSYGLAAAQLQRIRDHGLPLTAVVDRVAASGGYMMAAVANRIIAAPFSIVGSIGVLAQIPNFHRLLQKNNIDYEMLTAGEYKRTLSFFGENTEKGREKFREELEDTHQLFKEFLQQHRSQLDLSQVATGEHWFALRAKDLQLVDEIATSDEILLNAVNKEKKVYQVRYSEKRGLKEKLGITMQFFVDRLLSSWQTKEREAELLK